MKKQKIHPVDLYAGKQLRIGREKRRFSQEIVGKQLEPPVTFQQVQKYERGLNRMAASRIYEFAKLLNLPIGFFFPDEETVILPVLSADEEHLLRCYRVMSPAAQKAFSVLLNEMAGRDGL